MKREDHPPIRRPKGHLTFVVRDTAPLAVLQEPVGHRTVRVELTEEQLDRLSLRKTGWSGGGPIYESISMVLWEDEPEGSGDSEG